MMDSVHFKNSILSELIQTMANPYEKLTDIAQINKIVFVALNRTFLKALIEKTPSKTGSLAGKWELDNPAPFKYVFRNPEGDLIQILTEGTQEHIIKAKNKKFLRFKKPTERKSTYKKIRGNVAFEKDGFIFAKMVRHPGFEGRRWIEQIFENKKLFGEFMKLYNVEMKKYLGL